MAKSAVDILAEGAPGEDSRAVWDKKQTVNAILGSLIDTTDNRYRNDLRAKLMKCPHMTLVRLYNGMNDQGSELPLGHTQDPNYRFTDLEDVTVPRAGRPAR